MTMPGNLSTVYTFQENHSASSSQHMKPDLTVQSSPSVPQELQNSPYFQHMLDNLKMQHAKQQEQSKNAAPNQGPSWL